jgi:hypothetical protein
MEILIKEEVVKLREGGKEFEIKEEEGKWFLENVKTFEKEVCSDFFECIQKITRYQEFSPLKVLLQEASDINDPLSLYQAIIDYYFNVFSEYLVELLENPELVEKYRDSISNELSMLQSLRDLTIKEFNRDYLEVHISDDNVIFLRIKQIHKKEIIKSLTVSEKDKKKKASSQEKELEVLQEIKDPTLWTIVANYSSIKEIATSIDGVFKKEEILFVKGDKTVKVLLKWKLEDIEIKQ